MRRRILLLVVLSISLAGHSQAQRNARTVTTAIGTPGTGADNLYYANPQEPPRAIEFKKGTVTAAQFLAGIHRYLAVPAAFTFAEAESNTDKLGMRHHLLHQYYKGIVVEGMDYRVHEKDGFAVSANGKAVRNITLNTQTTLSEEQAYRLAVQYLHAGDSTPQPGRKLIVSKDFTFAPQSFAVAFQFDLDVSLLERWRVSIDARTGQLINKVSLVNTCGHKDPPAPPPYLTGTGQTNYYGNQSIRVEQTENGTRLVGQTAHGGRIGTYSYNNAPIILILLGFPFRVYDVTSANTTYTAADQKPAVSVQWAAEQAYEYYFQKHARNSFDNLGAQITSYVHVDVGLDNAYWTGKLLLFGDGSVYKPLVELDVVSHELTHGVTQYEAGLQYYNEPGALNESFSDIMAKAVEFHTFGDTATWQLGAHLVSGGLRDFSNPNLKDQPDTYQGDLWYSGTGDSGGVHYNSGVQNFWFYLLCHGGTGVNDHDFAYTVNPIGIEAAANITYRNLTEYLSPLSDYLDSRFGAMLATADLYGKNSAIYQEVDNAWDAVGVTDEPAITGLELYDITATTVKTRGTLIPRGDTVHYHFEYGTTPALGSATAQYPYTNTVQGIVTGLQPSTKYYIRLVATNEHGQTSSAITNFTTLSPAPLVKILETSDVTETTATLYGQINPNSLPTSFYFEYGPTPALGMTTPVYPAGDTTEFINISAGIAGLTPRTTYHYRLVAVNGFSTASTTSVSFFTAVRPVISAFTPVTAPIGTEVTITGQNFNATPGNNRVNFGATRAEILTASATELKVRVPPGASLGTISLLDTESGLVTESIREFVPTFSGAFSSGNLQLAVGYTDFHVFQPIVQDMDGDNKPDIVGAHNSQGFTVLQNIHQEGDITAGSFLRNSYSAGFYTNELYIADLNGDGTPDIAGKYLNGLRIYPNYSVPGYIFFGTPIDLPVGYSSYVALQDLDGDGHVDIVYTQYTENIKQLTVLRNQNPKGSLSAENFRPQYTTPLAYNPYSLVATDLNNDGNADLVLGSTDQSVLWMLRNDSRPGILAFEKITTPDPARGRFARYTATDLNGDGWKDVVLSTSALEGNVALWENKGSSPQITLAAPVSVANGYTQEDLQPCDLDGDGNTDLLIGTEKRELRLLRNKGEAGNPFSESSFEKMPAWGMVLGEYQDVTQRLAINDLDGDGRPEVINSISYSYGPHDGNIFEIWHNDASACLDPSLITMDVTNTTARIQLPPNTTFSQYEIEYTPGANDWYEVQSTTINNLAPGYPYQFRFRAKCGAGYTAYHYIDFTTDCVDPNNVTLGSISAYQVTLYAPDITQYEIQYSLATRDEWETLPYYYSTITSLEPGTTYDVRIRGRCVIPGPYRTLQVTTLCPTLESLQVTDINFHNAFVIATQHYAGPTILEYSPDKVTWTPVDESRVLSSLVAGTRYYVRGKAKCADTDSDFTTVEFTTRCPEIKHLTATAITPFGARVTWTDESNTNRYSIEYTLSNGTKTKAETTEQQLDLEGLAPGTLVQMRVSPPCASALTSTHISFTTACYTPYDLAVGTITHTTADLSWTADFSASPYTLEYSITGTNTWQQTQTMSEALTLTNLRPGTHYEVRVRINCADQLEDYARTVFQTTLYDKTVYFPNPSTGKVTIHPSKNLIGNRFILCDNLGRIIASGALPDYTIDLSNFSPGMYMLKIEGEELVKINKL